jgi:hypothetical protein
MRGVRRLILAFATQGVGGNDEARMRELLQNHDVEVFPFNRRSKLGSFWDLFRSIRKHRPALVVMEGTGVAGGLSVLLGRWLGGVPYVVSSGDAVGPWVASSYPWLGPLFGLYERVLCFWSAGFIGWTPYLAGRALSFGAPRAITAAGWAPFALSAERRAAARGHMRHRLGIPDQALVVGIAGALIWNRRVQYCYGTELVRAALQVRRPDFRVLIVGDGTGLAHLKRMTEDLTGDTVLFTGRVPRSEVPNYLAAMDVGSLPQSLDGVGSFRYTTKISEYLGARLPVITGQLPFAYDLDSGWLWRIPGEAPWTPRYVDSLAELIDQLTLEQIETKRSVLAHASKDFVRETQVARVTAFIGDLLDSQR